MKRLLITGVTMSLLIFGSGCMRGDTPELPAETPARVSTGIPSAGSIGLTTRSVVVDTAVLTATSKPGKNAAKYLADVQNILQKGLDDLLKTYKGRENTPEARNTILQAKAALDQELALRRQAVTVEMDRVIRQAVKSWRSRNGSAIVLPAAALVGYGTESDITAAVLPELDKLSLKLPDMPKISVTKPK